MKGRDNQFAMVVMAVCCFEFWRKIALLLSQKKVSFESSDLVFPGYGFSTLTFSPSPLTIAFYHATSVLHTHTHTNLITSSP